MPHFKGRPALVLVLLTSLLICQHSYSTPLEVRVDKSRYSPGDTVRFTIIGKQSTAYAVEFRGPGNQLIYVDQVSTDSSGMYSGVIAIDRSYPEGTYALYVAGGGEAYSLTITVARAAPTPPTAPKETKATASSAIATAEYRVYLLRYLLYNFTGYLRTLSVNVNLSEFYSTLDEAERLLNSSREEFGRGNYAYAANLASQASRLATDALTRAIELTRERLQEAVSAHRASVNDSLSISLLDVASYVLTTIKPTDYEGAITILANASRLIVAALKLSNVTALEESLASLETQLRALEDMYSQLEARLRELAEQRDTLAEQLNSMSAELGRAKATIEELEEGNRRLSEANAQLEDALEGLRRQLASRIDLALAALLAALALAAGLVAGYLLWGRGRQP